MGRDLQRIERRWTPWQFQSTRPVWGATARTGTRSPRLVISIHAPRVGRDQPVSLAPVLPKNFNPRAPCGARPGELINFLAQYDISIHAPRVGRDASVRLVNSASFNFNPRAPCGARRSLDSLGRSQFGFQSTRPVWGATAVASISFAMFSKFQSTRPVWGATFATFTPFPIATKFQSTRPVWGATLFVVLRGLLIPISIHAPRVGRDSKFDDFTPSNLHKRYKRVLARPKNTREKGKIKQKLAYIHAFSAFLGCEGSGTFCALVLRTQYR